MKHRLSLLILLLTGLQLARAATTLRGSSNSSEDNHLLVSSRGRSLGSMMMRTRSKQTRMMSTKKGGRKQENSGMSLRKSMGGSMMSSKKGMIMERSGVPCGRGTWEQVGSDITGPDPPLTGHSLTSFGRAVSLSHDGAIIAVGGPLAGAQVHKWIDGKWTQMGSDIKPGEGTFAVSLNKWGGRVAASASRTSTNGLRFNGAVKIYEYAGAGDWKQLGNSIVGEAAAEQIGEWEEALSLSEDGDTIAIGSFWKQVVRIYHFSSDDTTWSKIGEFVGSLNAGSYGFAVDLARNGRRLVISDPRAPFPGTKFLGQVIVYDYDSSASSWHQLGQVLFGDEDFDEFGASVSLSAKGDILAVGVDHSSQNNMGLVNVFHYEKSSGLWEPLGQTLIGGAGTSRARFGDSVSLSSDGMRLAVGGLQVYDFDGVSWCQVGQTVVSDEDSANFGITVSVSGDGERVAAGAPGSTGEFARVFALLV